MTIEQKDRITALRNSGKSVSASSRHGIHTFVK